MQQQPLYTSAGRRQYPVHVFAQRLVFLRCRIHPIWSTRHWAEHQIWRFATWLCRGAHLRVSSYGKRLGICSLRPLQLPFDQLLLLTPLLLPLRCRGPNWRKMSLMIASPTQIWFQQTLRNGALQWSTSMSHTVTSVSWFTTCEWIAHSSAALPFREYTFVVIQIAIPNNNNDNNRERVDSNGRRHWFLCIAENYLGEFETVLSKKESLDLVLGSIIKDEIDPSLANVMDRLAEPKVGAYSWPRAVGRCHIIWVSYMCIRLHSSALTGQSPGSSGLHHPKWSQGIKETPDRWWNSYKVHELHFHSSSWRWRKLWY